MTEMTEMTSGASSPDTDFFVPKWLTGEFLEKHFRNYFNNNELKVVDFDIEPATAKGENFACHLYRVKIKFINEPTKQSDGSPNLVSGSNFKKKVVNRSIKLSIGRFCKFNRQNLTTIYYSSL